MCLTGWYKTMLNPPTFSMSVNHILIYFKLLISSIIKYENECFNLFWHSRKNTISYNVWRRKNWQNPQFPDTLTNYQLFVILCFWHYRTYFLTNSKILGSTLGSYQTGKCWLLWYFSVESNWLYFSKKKISVPKSLSELESSAPLRGASF